MRVGIRTRWNGDVQSPESLRLWRKRGEQPRSNSYLGATGHAERRVARPDATDIDETRNAERVVRRESADGPTFFDASDASNRTSVA